MRREEEEEASVSRPRSVSSLSLTKEGGSEHRESGELTDLRESVSHVRDTRQPERKVAFLENSIKNRPPLQRKPARARTICLAISVEATMSLNSSKLSLPSPSWSASIMAARRRRVSVCSSPGEPHADPERERERKQRRINSLLSTICCSC